MMNGMMGGGFGGGFGLFGWLIQLAVIIGIIYLIIAVVKRSGFTMGSRNENQNSMEILKERYAKGEISEEEFERKKKLLNS